ncbi:hypothetical protein [Pandoraea morbifera]|uniref:hypothetical protein n=1 Tax=Pandoraea morbifera TaxID=2508300 RepID=UPI00124071F6|nr:hypothetical protein [Pandoraea morbifera]
MTIEQGFASGSDAAVWASLDEAKKLYQSYLDVTETSNWTWDANGVSSSIDVQADFPPLSLSTYR